eukprot:TRINITY_DN10254_c0_g1_i1.p2 TRINITY_DN10254_c0_g1~~TRINITY_DN10254_c0_g1_i1.p2  ORF type:complete len:134 (+),score=47.94 TRINITY_DN10254_c0_g1_i1:151-552(+)
MPSPLMAAAKRGDVALMRALLDAKADVNLTGGMQIQAIDFAVAGGSAKAVETLAAAKADLTGHDQEGCSPLGAAVTAGNVAVVEALLKAKADVAAPVWKNHFQRSEEPETALALAKAAGHDGIAKILAAAGAA